MHALLDPRTLCQRARFHLRYSLGVRQDGISALNLSRAFALAVREPLIDGLFSSEKAHRSRDSKRVYYLSMEFLMGRSLGNNLVNLGLLDAFRAAALEFGVDPDELLEAEPDAALGNGGLGRLAACFLDSLATLGLAGFGYGLHYEYGLFRQEFVRGHQREAPDYWGARESPWLLQNTAETILVPVYGRIYDPIDDGVEQQAWMDWKLLVGVPYDMPIAGYGGATVNYLRLYAARSSREFDIRIFNQGDYINAVRQKVENETVSKVLYPSDAVATGKELRLLQEYFLVACAVRDISDRFFRDHADVNQLPDKVAIQMNDTHPALAVAELMRLLMDEKDLQREQAWEITRAVCGYTNHTLLPEALERWPVDLLGRVLPRHMQIIYEINHHFLQDVARRWPADEQRLRRMSLIEEEPVKQVRMAHLAIIGSHAVNGVAKLHSRLVRESLVPDFARMYPDRFQNKTNGVTPRRWLLSANPELARLISRHIGNGWITDAEQWRRLEPLAEDRAFLDDFAAVKEVKKSALAKLVKSSAGVLVDAQSLFSVHAKRIHEYKRQLLHALLIIDRYMRIVDDGYTPPVARAFLVAGKAAPGYSLAKSIIRLINGVADVVNKDTRANGWMRVAFVPDYRVSLAEVIIPGANLSEQISTAGSEASGTGNMKFAMNGALTIGTLDGANIEIRDEVGQNNIFIFGHTTEEIAALRDEGAYDPRERLIRQPRLARVIEAVRENRFANGEPGVDAPILEALLDRGDRYFHIADFASYAETEDRCERAFADPRDWNRRALLNVARMGRFSSDRTIREYARDIWGIP
ncbi:MAG: glycogen/starch/alpha-glucan phosphorylase [Vicinamibacteria bacterium]|nr:glycogen/starch/alpha-glucan phosphorylase [Vicinamibacteria bacterium]